jgi:putative spermidine/putrescine transport system permease protein
MSLPLFMGMLARNHGWIGMMSAKTAATSLGWSFLGGNDILYTRRAVWIVMSFIFLPWTFFLLRLSLRGVTSLHVEAAASLGAGSRSIIIRLFIPAILRGGVISLLLVYCTSLGYFITPMMLGGNAYPLPGIYILKLIDLGSFDEASYLALVLLATTAPFATIFLYFIHRWRIFSI